MYQDLGTSNLILINSAFDTFFVLGSNDLRKKCPQNIKPVLHFWETLTACGGACELLSSTWLESYLVAGQATMNSEEACILSTTEEDFRKIHSAIITVPCIHAFLLSTGTIQHLRYIFKKLWNWNFTKKTWKNTIKVNKKQSKNWIKNKKESRKEAQMNAITPCFCPGRGWRDE